jgi:hypothetical protein
MTAVPPTSNAAILPIRRNARAPAHTFDVRSGGIRGCDAEEAE